MDIVNGEARMTQSEYDVFRDNDFIKKTISGEHFLYHGSFHPVVILERSQEDIDLIYKHTHKDYKGITDGEKCCLWLGEHGTTSGPIAVMPEKIFQEKLASAKRKEAK